MKKRVLCYGDSNTWGFNAMNENVYGQRFPEEVRWTGRLQTLLGENWTVIEEGLCGRTTVFEDPLREGLNGLQYLGPCLATHNPIDYLILMLGTNDCKARFSALPKNIERKMTLPRLGATWECAVKSRQCFLRNIACGQRQKAAPFWMRHWLPE